MQKCMYRILNSAFVCKLSNSNTWNACICKKLYTYMYMCASYQKESFSKLLYLKQYIFRTGSLFNIKIIRF
jgi:hypothetical protein